MTREQHEDSMMEREMALATAALELEDIKFTPAQLMQIFSSTKSGPPDGSMPDDVWEHLKAKFPDGKMTPSTVLTIMNSQDGTTHHLLMQSIVGIAKAIKNGSDAGFHTAKEMVAIMEKSKAEVLRLRAENDDSSHAE